MRRTPLVASIVFSLATSANATTVFDFFSYYENQKYALQIAIVTEALRHARQGHSESFGCIRDNFLLQKGKFLPRYEDLTEAIYSSPTPSLDVVEHIVAEHLNAVCPPSLDKAARNEGQIDTASFGHPTNVFLTTKTISDAERGGDVLIALATQAEAGNDPDNTLYSNAGERTACLNTKFAHGQDFQADGLKALFAEIIANRASQVAVENSIIDAALSNCGDLRFSSPPVDAAKTDQGAPQSDLDRKNQQLYEGFRKRADATEHVLNQMQADNEKELEDARKDMANLINHGYRVPDGRRIYPSDGGSWIFENQQPVPEALVSQRIAPPELGWPSIDLRSSTAAQTVLETTKHYGEAPPEIVAYERSKLPANANELELAIRLQIFYEIHHGFDQTIDR